MHNHRSIHGILLHKLTNTSSEFNECRDIGERVEFPFGEMEVLDNSRLNGFLGFACQFECSDHLENGGRFEEKVFGVRPKNEIILPL